MTVSQSVSQSDGKTWCSCKIFVEVVVMVVVARAFLLDEMLRCASDRKELNQDAGSIGDSMVYHQVSRQRFGVCRGSGRDTEMS